MALPDLLLRIAVATVGAYFAAACWTAAFALAWPGPRADAVLLGTLTSFAAAAAVAIWAFAARSARRALGGLAAVLAPLALAAWLAGPT